MPKSANVVPNLRIDIPDYKAQTADYSQAGLDLHLDSFILDNFAAIADGFRVEIADQGTSPKELTVVNGVAFDRSGRIVNNETDTNAARSLTLPADGTYYIEIEYVTSESDSDARALWDPSFDNGTEPSGDPIPDGREFNTNISTRLTPDWNFVSPVSTTAFEYTTVPNSTRIPVAVITVSGGVISGGTTSPLQTVVGSDVAGGAGTVTLLDTRAMPDGFTLNLDPGGGNDEDVTVSQNDRDNGILTLVGTTANAHVAGTRAVVAGGTPAEYLVERTGPTIPSSGTEDARPRFYQGDEARGEVLSVDPQGTGLDRGDVSLTTLKRYVDFMAGQIRELKFGSMVDADVGDVAPPSAFPAVPHYFDSAGGVAGARSCTVSVGDGVSTFGDFNTVQSGSASQALTDAIAALPAAGGRIYVKAGTYTITTIVDVTKAAQIFGDGVATVLDVTTTAPFSITSDNVSIRDMKIELDVGATVDHAVLIDGVDNVSVINVEFEFNEDQRAILIDNTLNALKVDACTFTQLTTANLTEGVAIDWTQQSGQVNNGSLISNCRFIDVDVGISGFQFARSAIRDCYWTTPTADRTRLGIQVPANVGVTWQDIVIDGCQFEDFGDLNTTVIAGMYFQGNIGGHTRVTISNCRFADLGPAADVHGILYDNAITAEDLIITSNMFARIDATAATGVTSGIQFGSGITVVTSTITDNKFEDIGLGTPATYAGINIGACEGIAVLGNSFVTMGSTGAGDLNSAAISITPSTSTQRVGFRINDNDIHNVYSDTTAHGILLQGSAYGVTIANNTIRADESSFIAIEANGPTGVTGGNVGQLTITGNVIEASASTDIWYGINVILLDDTLGSEGRVVVSNNVIRDYGAVGISVEGDTGALVTNGCVVSGNVTESSNVVSVGIFVNRLNRFAVTGNSVLCTNTTGGPLNTGIWISDAINGTVAGNMVDMQGNHSGVIGINTQSSGTDYVMVSGNFVQMGTVTGANGIGIRLGDAQYCAANFVHFLNSGGTGTAIENLGASTSSTARTDNDDPSGTGADPITDDWSDIGLNRRNN